MTRKYPTTPLWVKLTAAGVLAAAVTWWIADWRDRHGNEQRLGATADQGRAMALAQFNGVYQEMPDRYRSGACADGGALDLQPDDAGFP